MSKIREYLHYFYDSGVTEFMSSGDEVREPTSTFQSQHIKPLDPINQQLQAVDSIEGLKKMVNEFNGCELKKTANKTVFADGDPRANIMFIGEAPGASEDAQGIPFCGQSGKLLDNIIKAMGFARSEVYITNAVFWRPPANRRPTPEEIDICRPFVQKHIALVAPKMIVMVGSTAVEALFNATDSMHSLRGKVLKYENSHLEAPVPATVIFHPSYLLRQQQKKRLMWEDVCAIRRHLKV